MQRVVAEVLAKRSISAGGELHDRLKQRICWVAAQEVNRSYHPRDVFMQNSEIFLNIIGIYGIYQASRGS